MKTLQWSANRVLEDGRRIPATLSTAIPIESLPIAPHSLEAALEELVVPVPMVKGADTPHGILSRYVSEEHPASRIRPTLPAQPFS